MLPSPMPPFVLRLLREGAVFTGTCDRNEFGEFVFNFGQDAWDLFVPHFEWLALSRVIEGAQEAGELQQTGFTETGKLCVTLQACGTRLTLWASSLIEWRDSGSPGTFAYCPNTGFLAAYAPATSLL